MRITASAPGKLVLLGEYAVLVGVPALVLAINRRAQATLTPASGEAWEIVSPTLDLEAHFRLRQGGIEWTSGTPPAELAWVTSLFEQVPQLDSLAPCRVELDTSTFYLDDGGVRVKLGLGSSAALTVALLGALHQYAELPAPTLAESIDVHRAIQHGRGSGIDIAASLCGGLSRFQLDSGVPSCTPAWLPSGLHWRCIYTGRATSTREMLEIINRWRQHERPSFTRRMRELATISKRSVDAVVTRDAHAFLSTVRGFGQSLVRFGEAAGADIVSREHRAIGALAASYGCVYKSCGAGGGDAGITFGMSERQLGKFAAHAEQAGFRVIELDPDPKGLDVKSTD